MFSGTSSNSLLLCLTVFPFCFQAWLPFGIPSATPLIKQVITHCLAFLFCFFVFVFLFCLFNASPVLGGLSLAELTLGARRFYSRSVKGRRLNKCKVRRWAPRGELARGSGKCSASWGSEGGTVWASTQRRLTVGQWRTNTKMGSSMRNGK